MNWATPYDRATNCTGGPTQGARALLAWLLETYPPARSLGIYNCRTVRGGSTTSTHGEGRAVDLGLPLGSDGKGTPYGHGIVNRVGAHGARLGVQAAIYDREIWSAQSPSGRYYGGSHPHYDHIHFELTREAGSRLTLATLRAVLGTDVQEDGTMDKNSPDGDAVRWFQEACNGWVEDRNRSEDPLVVDGNFGSLTEGMVRAYQRSAELRVTGAIDGPTAVLLARYHPENRGGGGGLTEAQVRAIAKGHRHRTTEAIY